MRHKKKFNHLGRKRGHRKAMLSNMASSLIIHKRIKTTTAKAKALKVFVEPLITKAKEDTTHSRRQVFSYLQDKDATNEMFREVVVKVGDRPGGYTRIIKLGKRLGDNADMCIIELVDFNENMLADKASAKSSRRRRGGKKKSQTTDTTAETKAEETVQDNSGDNEEVVAEDHKKENSAAEETSIEEKKEVTEEIVAEEKKDETEADKDDSPSAEIAPDKDAKKEE